MKNYSAKHLDLANIIAAMLILLWVYTAVSKLSDVDTFQRQLYKQHLDKNLLTVLTWALPLSEITAACFLIFKGTRLIGMAASLILMTIFTGYIALVLLGFFDKIPCSCGGILKNLGWTAHLWFNIIFLFLAFLGCYYLWGRQNTTE